MALEGTGREPRSGRESRDALHRAATMYYLEHATMEAVGKQLGVSRSSVSRLLKQAREQGIVRISVSDAVTEHPASTLLARQFGVRTHVVPVRSGAPTSTRLDATCRVAAGLLTEWVGDRQVIGLAWGTTLSTVVSHLAPTPRHGVVVVQLNGFASAGSTGLGNAAVLLGGMASAFDAEFVQFPAPAFFDYAQTRAALWQERAVARVIDLQHQCDIAVFGIGASGGEVPSQVYAGDFLRQSDLRDLHRERVVGDVCTVFVREDGSWRDIALNERASGLPPDQLRRIPRRVCVAAGAAKVPGIVGALRAGAVTDLVVDDHTLTGVHERLLG
ncbi:sugar-binding transcriptional regulator [Dermacoccaceae bacterium W4C1]